MQHAHKNPHTQRTQTETQIRPSDTAQYEMNHNVFLFIQLSGFVCFVLFLVKINSFTNFATESVQIADTNKATNCDLLIVFAGFLAGPAGPGSQTKFGQGEASARPAEMS